jgi:hypothetical protein
LLAWLSSGEKEGGIKSASQKSGNFFILTSEEVIKQKVAIEQEKNETENKKMLKQESKVNRKSVKQNDERV